MRLPATTRRVEQATPEHVNERIRRETGDRVVRAAGDERRIERRLAALDHEWDVERTLQTNFSLVTLAGLTLAALAGRRWLVLPFVTTGFLLQHALQGWCPPVPVLRRLGVRTSAEIEQERYALKALRGDFDTGGRDPHRAIAAARR
jgi:sirohydrochlorin ferrochelatase